MKYLVILSLILSAASLVVSLRPAHNLGASVTDTVSSDTFNTFRTNVNNSLDSLNAFSISSSSAMSWTGLQTFFGNASSTAISATSSAYFATSAGKVGIASTTPTGTLSLGTAGATSTASFGRFCFLASDEAGRTMWIKLSISGNTVFSTSTSPCNQ